MYIKLSTPRVSTGSIYKLIFIGTMLSLVPLGVFYGAIAALGFNTVNWNGKPLYGVSALFAGPLMGLMMSLMLTAFGGSMIAFGLWLYSKFKPITIGVMR